MGDLGRRDAIGNGNLPEATRGTGFPRFSMDTLVFDMIGSRITNAGLK